MELKSILQALKEKKITPEEAKKEMQKLNSGYKSKAEKEVKEKIDEGEESIAIIGISGRYPNASNLDEFWDVLANGKNAVREIPDSRWNMASYYDSEEGKEGKIYCKWMGMLDDIDCFDSLFFEIPPSEAEVMDPQHRLFLEEGYKAFEDAGYTRSTLNNKRCGVYLGIVNGEYDALSQQNGVAKMSVTGNSNAIGAARIAYYLNLKGPAIPIDTACSSSLVGAHLASQALVNREIDMALVGGVSLYLSPESYISMCMAGMLSADGQCKAFDNDANGFVPAEGVGAIVLKRLKDAEADHDHIYGVIIGSGINQDGRTNGITAPNLGSQIQLARDVYTRYHINPETITYAELHGTGTKLGDPIELEALATAFSEKTNKKNFCEIGSVKSNIGHTSASAAIAGIHKILLCMKNKQLVPTLHVSKPNEHFNFEDSPFHINKETKTWKSVNGKPYRACISSFGYSGTNAQAVIEAYNPKDNDASQIVIDEVHKGLFILSAKNKTQLKIYVKRIKGYVENNPDVNLANLLYTLQVGREAMEERVMIVTSGYEDLLEKLNLYLKVGEDNKAIFSARVTRKTMRLKENINNGAAEVKGVVNNEGLIILGQDWLKGNKIEWEKLYEGHSREKLSLPTYPFEKERHWFIDAEENKIYLNQDKKSKLHPLVHENISDFSEEHFRSYFTGNEEIFTNHKINQKKVLPGAAILEMVRAAAKLAASHEVCTIENVVWEHSIEAGENGITVDIRLYPEDNATFFEVSILDKIGQDEIVCAEGKITYNHLEDAKAISVEHYKNMCSNYMDSKAIYKNMKENGIAYGEMFQTLDQIAYSEHEVFVHLRPFKKQSEFSLNPGLLDGALQSVALLIGSNDSSSHIAYLPFSVGKIEIYGQLLENAYVYTTYAENSTTGLMKFNLKITDEKGNIIAQILDFSVRPIKNKASHEELAQTLYFESVWEESSSIEENRKNALESVIVFDEHDELKEEIINKDITKCVILIKKGNEYKVMGPHCYMIRPLYLEDYKRVFEALMEEKIVPSHLVYNWALCSKADSLDENLDNGIYTIFVLTQALLNLKLKNKVKLLYLYKSSKEKTLPEYAALSGLFKTIQAENPLFIYKTIELQNEVEESISKRASMIVEEFFKTEELVSIRFSGEKRFVKQIREIQEKPSDENLIQKEDVYLITGGLGGLGLIFSRYLSQKVQAKLILVGRKKIEKETLKSIRELEANGSEVMYIRGDVSNWEETQNVVQKAKEKFGHIDGVLHCAGITRDALMWKKKIEEVESVLAPKVYGSRNLDFALKDEHLKFFVMASSLASVLGNIGQCDYCYANSYMDHFASERNMLSKEGKRYGKTISINWPFWKEGGMSIDEESQNWMRDKAGIMSLETRRGLQAFEDSMNYNVSEILVFNGNANVIRQLFDANNKNTPAKQMNLSEQTIKEAQVDEKKLRERVYDYLKGILSQKTKISEDKIDVTESFETYGIDSILIMSLTRTLEETFGELSKTLFFEYQNLEELANYFIAHKKTVLLEKLNAFHTPEEIEASEDDEAKASVVEHEMIAKKRKRFNYQGMADKEKKVQQDIAIIGMSGRYPMADNLDIFWENLKQGKDCITEIPAERWDYHKYYNEDKNAIGSTYSKWGGFINKVSRFDPLFFNIPPIDAEMLDPQTRLFLETTWEAIEDAGYTRKSLAKDKVGVFVGVMYGMYELYEGEVRGKRVPIGSSFATIANRVSYFCDFKGPSMAIDTMCSSSLTALHLGCESIKRGESDLVIAGGVNLTIHPNKHILLSLGKFTSSDGRCRSFGEGGDGYVPGEGVGAVLLKPLNKAIADKDHIYGIIKATMINSGGKTSGFTVPNPNAQAELIEETLKKANVDARTISYIETHGTGTALGDPIEITGLTKAFGEREDKKQYCAIGSVKANIGHLESAAGMAALTKVLLQLKNKQLVPSIHSTPLNPYIKFEETPFYVEQELKDWERPIVSIDGQTKEYPRRAGISSFGAGGGNAHVIIEEYIADKTPIAQAKHGAELYVLSAKNKDRLKAYVSKLLKEIEKGESQVEAQVIEQKLIKIIAGLLKLNEESIDLNSELMEYGIDPVQVAYLQEEIYKIFKVQLSTKAFDETTSISKLAVHISKIQGVSEILENSSLDLTSLAYTLQVGREAMEERIAIVAKNAEELSIKLRDYLNENTKELYVGNILDSKRKLKEISSKEDYKQKEMQLLKTRRLDELAKLWVMGAPIDWAELYKEKPYKISLPTYPFAEEVCWAMLPEDRKEGTAHKGLHPLIDCNTSTINGLRFSKTFNGTESFLKDHIVKENMMLPGVVYLEMIRAAVAKAMDVELETGVCIKNVVWLKPVEVKEKEITLNVEFLGSDDAQMDFVIYSICDGEKIVHCEGCVSKSVTDENEESTLDEIRRQCSKESIEGKYCYRYFEKSGIVYGKTHQSIEKMHYGNDEILVELVAKGLSAKEQSEYVLVPGILDAALQGAIGLSISKEELEGKLSQGNHSEAAVPFAIDEVEIIRRCQAKMWAHVYNTQNTLENHLQKMNIALYDEEGNLCILLKQVSFRKYTNDTKQINSNAQLLFTKQWKEKAVGESAQSIHFEKRIILLCQADSRLALQVTNQLEDTTCINLTSTAERGSEKYQDYVAKLLEIVKQEIINKHHNKILIQVLIESKEENQVLAGLSGFLNTVQIENQNIVCQLITLDKVYDLAEIVKCVGENEIEPTLNEICYKEGKRWSHELTEITNLKAQPIWQDDKVYLITGGIGGLGYILSKEIVNKARNTKLILAGRSPIKEEIERKLEALRLNDTTVIYKQVDVTSKSGVTELIKETMSTFGKLNAVIHCSGINRDHMIIKKDEEELRAVLAPKVLGVSNLDEATREIALDYFICFASMAGVTGNIGQADYAAANAFMDCFARDRNERVAKGLCMGHTLSVDWPYWADGGMRIEESIVSNIYKSTGISPIHTKVGLQLLYASIASGKSQVLALEGERTKINQYLFESTGEVEEESQEKVGGDSGQKAYIEEQLIMALKRILSDEIKLDVERIDERVPLETYGINSIMIVELTDELEKIFGSLPKTLFFEYQSLKELSEYLCENYSKTVVDYLGIKESKPASKSLQENSTSYKAKTEPYRVNNYWKKQKAVVEKLPRKLKQDETQEVEIAIVGMAGQYPQAENLEAYWENLKGAKDCITEIPKDRWDHSIYYDEDKTKSNKTYAKWGGFVKDAQCFDPLFFNISPGEAEVMDPQERLFLQCVYHAIEDAGYTRGTLGKEVMYGLNNNVGVFVGVMYEEYQLYAAQAQARGQMITLNGSAASIANRVSYICGFHGPSIAVDSMCSSSLVSIHLACKSLRDDECEVAVAGGVNLSIHPNKYLMLGQNRFMSSKGRCETFGKDGDGYTPGEGVGAIILKTKDKAIADGDHIYGIIRGIAINHGGKTNGYTVPNPSAQASVISAAMEKAGVNPRAISYIEAHGTGTSLGDPIEIAGLTKAFRKQTKDNKFCLIGSAKSNIGHCESAAGIAAVTKVLLQMKHHQIVPSIHSEELNPNIDFENSPFVVAHELVEWQRPMIHENGIEKQYPRLAGISAFGAGGTNVHLILEEYIPENDDVSEIKSDNLYMILLSARGEEQLNQQASRLLDWIYKKAPADECLKNIAYTLQIGREPMEKRLAFVVSDIKELEARLKDFLSGKGNCYKGNVKNVNNVLNIFDSDEELQEVIRKWFKEKKYTKLLELWVKGLNIDWKSLYEDKELKRMSLPTYPFAKERYWVPEDKNGLKEEHLAPRHIIHPLVHENVSDLFEQRYSTVFTGKEPFLRDHLVNGKKTLPAVVYIEMASAAIINALRIDLDHVPHMQLKDITWMQALCVEDEPVQVYMSLSQQNTSVNFKVYRLGSEQKEFLYCTGTVEVDKAFDSSKVEITKLRNICSDYCIGKEELYKYFKNIGIDYGESQRALKELYVEQDKAVLAHMILPDELEESMQQYRLYPSIMDAALQAAIGMTMQAADEGQGGKTKLPFMIEEINVLNKCQQEMYAYIEKSQGDNEKLDINIYDAEGNLCIAIKSIYYRTIKTGSNDEAPQDYENMGRLIFTPSWKEQAINRQMSNVLYDKHLVILGNMKPEKYEEMRQALKDKECLLMQPEGRILESRMAYYASYLFNVIKQEISNKQHHKVFIQVLVNEDDELSLGLRGLLQTAHLENPNIKGQIIQLDYNQEINKLRAVIDENAETSDEVILYKEGIRYSKQYEECESKEVRVPWKDNGVYLITGGLGGLGLIFTKEIVSQTQGSTIILTGRSALTEEKKTQLEKIRNSSTSIIYKQVDVCDESEVKQLLQDIQKELGMLNGIIHCAGIVQDNFIYKKTQEEFLEVLAPKVRGTLYLDRASKDIPMDFFILCSSLSGVTGNVGQADYALANAIMDDFATYRQKRVENNERFGITKSINWPLWKDGGLHIDDELEKSMMLRTGMSTLETSVGIAFLYKAVALKQAQVVVVEGKPEKIRELFKEKEVTNVEGPTNKQVMEGSKTLYNETLHFMKQAFGAILKMPVEKLLDDELLERYGIDSIMIMKLTEQLEKTFGELPKTLLFEYQTIGDITQYFVENCKEDLAKLFPKKEQKDAPKKEVKAISAVVQKGSNLVNNKSSRFKEKTSELKKEEPKEEAEIAIIGISGSFAESEDLQELWKNLENGVDCISEVPASRWDHSKYFNKDKEHPGTAYTKWGGFMKHVDYFDPLFFNISPMDAEIMDPQERVFLETAYEAIEDAGYTRQSLGYNPGGEVQRNVGVYVGVMNEEYQLYAAQQQILGNPIVLSGNTSSVANRVSYFCDFHGPSLSIDTMCSSSLVAVHMACQGIKNGDCEIALAGGVNIISHPNKYLLISQSKFASTNGRCMSFGKGGDGYVPGEGTGAILLKHKDKAIADGDHIYGVIKGIAVNHGGKTNGYTVPNPVAQREVISTALENAHVDAKTISYVEAHGTGTALGDPIEISALNKAFGKYTNAKGYCAIGSIKSNIGHCESASGVAAIAKVLLQMQHEEIVPSLHSKELNPNINFKDSLFFVPQELMAWKRPIIEEDGQTKVYPRRAGISSFGAGGTNVHLIIEEYIEGEKCNNLVDQPSIIVLSAKTEERLNLIVSRMLEVLKNSTKQIALSDIAYTLQVGREAMEERIAFVVRSKEELISKLEKYREDGQHTAGIYHNSVYGLASHVKYKEEELREAQKWIQNQEYEKICDYWVQGKAMKWDLLYAEGRPQRISLPTYPFEQERYWVALVDGNIDNRCKLPQINALIHKNISTLYEQKFSSKFSGKEPFLKDHCLGEREVLPGSAILEMVRGAAGLSEGRAVTGIKNVVWLNQVDVEDHKAKEVITRLIPIEEGLEFGVSTINSQGKAEGQICTQGEISFKEQEKVKTLDISQIKARCENVIRGESCYEGMQTNGLINGESFRVIEKIDYNNEEALATLSLPQNSLNETQDYVLNPSLLNGAFQSVVSMMPDEEEDIVYLPFALSEVKIYRAIEPECMVHIKKYNNNTQKSIRKFDLTIVNELGEVLVSIKEFALKAFKVNSSENIAKEENVKVKYYEPSWHEEESKLIESTQPIDSKAILIFDTNRELYENIREQLRVRQEDTNVILVLPGKHYVEETSNIFNVNLSNKDDYSELLQTLKTRGIKITHIIFYREPYKVQEETLAGSLEDGIYALFNLTQELMREKLKGKIELIFAFVNEQEEIIPEYSAISGFSRIIHMENPSFFYKTVELYRPEYRREEVDKSQYAEILLNEFKTASQAIEIRYEGRKRLVRGLDEIE